MMLLGHFKYHTHEVKLECNVSETKYTLTLKETPLSRIVSSQLKPTHVIYPYTNLGIAMTAFENAINDIIGKTRPMDVSIYARKARQ